MYHELWLILLFFGLTIAFCFFWYLFMEEVNPKGRDDDF